MNSEYFQFIEALIKAIDGTRYAIGGSFASSMYGEVRSTYDVDISIQLTTNQISSLVEAFTKLDWYVFPEGIEKAVQNGGDFQVIDGNTSLKADFYVTNPEPTPRQQRTLDRSRILPYGDSNQTACFMSPEDVILYKLEWYQMGKSEKHLRDIRVMLSTQRETLDYSYIDQWLDEFHVRETWDKVRENQ